MPDPLAEQRTAIATMLESEADRRRARGHRHVPRLARIAVDAIRARFDQPDEPAPEVLTIDQHASPSPQPLVGDECPCEDCND